MSKKVLEIGPSFELGCNAQATAVPDGQLTPVEQEIVARYDGTLNGPHGLETLAARYRINFMRVCMIIQRHRGRLYPVNRTGPPPRPRPRRDRPAE